MPTSVSVAEVLWEGTARTVRDATDAWKEEERGAARALATDLLLQAAVDLVQVTQQLVARKWDDLFSERIRDVESMGQRLEKWTETARRLAEGTRELATLVETEGYKVEKVPALEAGIAKLLDTKARLAKHWPRFDPTRLDQGLAQAARGDFVDAEEIGREFPELQIKSGS